MEPKMFLACVVFVLLSWTDFTQSVLPKNKIKVENNGYNGVTVAISQKIQEDVQYINKLKELFTAASDQLYKSTKYHLYFKQVTIVVPKTWSRKAEYGRISGPQYDLAHVVLDEQNDLVGNRPYVVGVTECGAEGQHIHITPYSLVRLPMQSYLAKSMVHQWGRLRWGLFGEYPEAESPRLGQEKYYYGTDGTFRPNTCSEQISGRFLKYCFDPSSECSLQDGVPEPGCQFCPNDPSDASSSIMGYFYINGITEFCDEASDSVNRSVHHNKKADTLQNRHCGGKSSWYIMRQHPDFSGLTPGNPIMVTAPTFNVVQQDSQKVVIVMDISGSMNTNNKLQKLVQASTYYLLNIVDSGTKICLVVFSTTASIIQPLAQMSSDSVRQQFVYSLPQRASGGTSIGAGLRKGIQCLTDAGETTEGSVILLISDGDERNSPKIRDVRQEVEDAGVVVTSLAFTDQSDIQMIELAASTGGRSFLYSGLENSTVLLDAFALSTAQTGDTTNALILIESISISVSSSAPYSGTFIIDSSIGKETTIVLSGGSLDHLSISASSPSLDTFRSGQCGTSNCSLRISGLAERGVYRYTVTSTSNTEKNVICSIQSNQRTNNAPTIIANSWTSGDTMDIANGSTIRLYTSVMRRGAPILGASVRAVLDGSANDILLLDKGYGADTIENDGIYSAYILPKHLSGNGRTSAKVSVDNKDGSATVIVPLSRRKRNAEPLPGNVAVTTAQADLFKRTALAGEFTTINYEAATATDILAPSRISTLEVISSDYVTRRFGLRFKAVGDDYDDGKATAYDVRISRDFDKLFNDPDSTFRVTDNIPTPGDPGTSESINVELPNSFSTYYVGIRAVDENNNKGELSNVVSLSILSDTNWLASPTTTPLPVTAAQADSAVERDALIALIGTSVAAFVFLIMIIITIVLIKIRMREKRLEKERKKRKSKKESMRSNRSSSSRSTMYRDFNVPTYYHTNGGVILNTSSLKRPAPPNYVYVA
ncbi:hypothetical protein FSP39_008730 [Pinctada imbricata]|uniref:VWFA domain-containing protein n=1 Tax=Pinctada imbricata TaxID=66713 RepID=A0AA88YC25_PINIB|nr:hypothetical protein FSP39_008730 [Pinctada imbricata]